MTLAPLLARFEEKVKTRPEFRASVKFDMGADGVIVVDTTRRPAEVREGDAPAALVLQLSKDLLEGLLDGTKDPNVAYLTGRLRVRGPMALAMKLNAFLED